MHLLDKLSATGLFVQELILKPKHVGAVLPSSRGLCRAMAKWLPLDSDACVLELGPGTGSVTEAIIERGLPQERLIAIEQSEKMAHLLRKRFPRAQIITGDAFKLEELLHTRTKHAKNIGVVFSSLPLLNFEAHAADNLARQIRSVLPPGGKLIQYSYGIGRKQPKAAEHFEFHASKVVWLNVPPARVSVYRK